MPRKPNYLLTPTARRQLREAKAWSLSRWGEERTEEYFVALDEAASYLSEHYKTYRSRKELSGGTGLALYPVREHYLVYEPLVENQIVVVAVLRQERDIAGILQRGKHVIARELTALRKQLKEVEE